MISTDPIRILADALAAGHAPPLSWAVTWCDPDGRFPRAWDGTLDARAMCDVVGADYDALFPSVVPPIAKVAAAQFLAALGAMIFPKSEWLHRRSAAMVVRSIMGFGGRMVHESDRMRELYPAPPRLQELVERVKPVERMNRP